MRTTSSSTVDAIRAAAGILFEKGQVIELRVLNYPRGQATTSGYFDDLDALAKAAAIYNCKTNIYVTLNTISPALLARSHNRVKEWAKTTTADDDVTRRRWLPIDFDPVRPSGISSSDAEHKAALDRAKKCRAFLSSFGWPEPVEADSGNGAHLLYAIDLANNAGAKELVEGCLAALDFLFGDETAHVDTTVFNAARIWKLYGTTAVKGDSTPDRPHRVARVLSAPDRRVVVPVDLLEALAARKPPEEPKATHKGNGKAAGRFDVPEFLARYHLEVASEGPWNDGYKWVLSVCPWNPDHTNLSAYVIRHPSGAVSAGCHHNSCRQKRWEDLRQLFEPGCYDGKREWAAPGATLEAESEESEEEEETPVVPEPPWPDPPKEEAYYGLAGDVVKMIEPASEADPVALLVQVLIGFGNVVGRHASFRVESDDHFPNEFAVLVGRTSKARKGTSWTRIERLMWEVERQWVDERVETGLSSGEGLIWAVRDPIRKRERIKQRGRPVRYEDVEVDPGVSDKRLMVYEPEWANVLKQTERVGNTVSAILRQAWDSRNLRSLTKNSPARATKPHISLVGHITADELRRYLSTTETANGFANRHLFLCIKRSKVLPEGGYVDDNAWTSARDKLADALHFAKFAGEVKRDEEAKAIWREVYPGLSEGRPGLAGALLARAEAHVMRLALLYALMDRSNVIKRSHLLAALALWDYVERSVYFLFAGYLGDPLADEVYQMLLACPAGMTRWDLSNAMGRNVPADRIGRALGVLLKHRMAHMKTEKAATRPKQRWFAGAER
jgi:hypothetical protein